MSNCPLMRSNFQLFMHFKSTVTTGIHNSMINSALKSSMSKGSFVFFSLQRERPIHHHPAVRAEKRLFFTWFDMLTTVSCFALRRTLISASSDSKTKPTWCLNSSTEQKEGQFIITVGCVRKETNFTTKWKTPEFKLWYQIQRFTLRYEHGERACVPSLRHCKDSAKQTVTPLPEANTPHFILLQKTK